MTALREQHVTFVREVLEVMGEKARLRALRDDWEIGLVQLVDDHMRPFRGEDDGTTAEEIAEGIRRFRAWLSDEQRRRVADTRLPYEPPTVTKIGRLPPRIPITLQVSVTDHALLQALVQKLNERIVLDEHTSHGPLTVDLLVAMVVEDVVLAQRRPGSWEGAMMLELLGKHGYGR